MIRAIMMAAALFGAAPAAAQSRADRALNGERPPYIDPGPADVKLTGTFLIRLLPAHQVRAICPAAIDWHSIGCTLLPSRVIIFPDEDSSGLSIERWLIALRHELLHAMGLDLHGPRP